jgi:hypothetical protein
MFVFNITHFLNIWMTCHATCSIQFQHNAYTQIKMHDVVLPTAWAWTPLYAIPCSQWCVEVDSSGCRQMLWIRTWFSATSHCPHCMLPECKLNTSDTYLVLSSFLGMFAKLWRATVIFAMSVCLFIHLHRTIWLLLDRFSWNLVFEDI